jgi:GT2 family glycosyltransferase
MSVKSIFVHIVTFNSAVVLEYCLGALLRQRGFKLGSNLSVVVRDNMSSDQSIRVARSFEQEGVVVKVNGNNLGFCGAHNQGVYDFLEGGFDYLLILNPDLRLADNALERLSAGFEQSEQIGLATPRLYRADGGLRPLQPLTLDAAGMVLTRSLRHFDRGAGELERGQYNDVEEVFGATGAALLLSKACVKSLVLSGEPFESDVDKIYPQLAEGRSSRALLFDEAFFAYREDADLSWRAQLLGFKCLYVADAIGYHQRVVTPERRGDLPPEFNCYSVRNRFLLQINNFRWQNGLAAIVVGLFVRNMIVILGVLFIERSSWPAFRQLIILWRRAVRRRRVLFNKVGEIENG